MLILRASLFGRGPVFVLEVAHGTNKKPLSSRMFRLVAGLVFCWMLLLNCLTPYLADDYTFAYAFDTGERLHSLPQLISSLVFHYHEWSGRVIVKFLPRGSPCFPSFCLMCAMLGCLWCWVWFCTSWPLGGAAKKRTGWLWS